MDITKKAYSDASVISVYSKLSNEIGLWESEKIIFDKFVDKSNKILDLGCGVGRTTFGFYDKGYTDIIGLDLSDSMIDACKEKNRKMNLNLTFVCGDATNLDFNDGSFDIVLFSFNGWPTIPRRSNRQLACREVHRVLKDGGFYIFTTLDISNPLYLDYWANQKTIWEKGLQDDNLNEFGDVVSIDRKSDGTVKTFVHIHSREEVIEDLEAAGFEILYSELRSKIVKEKQVTIDNSGDSIFWVCKKR